MNNSFKQPRYVLLFLCSLILLFIFVLAFTAPLLITAVKSDPDITTQFNFPRYLSATEIAGPPKIQGTVRYSFYSSDPEKRGAEINWSHILDDGPYDVVIIGDSFLGGTQAGSNMCRKISADDHVSVLHFYTNDIEYGGKNPFQLLTILTNNEFLKKTGAKVIKK